MSLFFVLNSQVKIKVSGFFKKQRSSEVRKDNQTQYIKMEDASSSQNVSNIVMVTEDSNDDISECFSQDLSKTHFTYCQSSKKDNASVKNEMAQNCQNVDPGTITSEVLNGNKPLNNPTLYTHNIEVVHQGLKRHPCPHCQFKTSRRNILKNHIETIHQGLWKHSCPHCQYKASRKFCLKKHIEVVHQGLKKYSCPYCQFKASQRTHLKQHIEVVHQGLKKYSCPYCRFKASQRTGLKQHIEAVHQGLQK